jgi:hypothetical protein
MANAVYPKYKAAAISGGSLTNLLTNDVKLVLVDTGTYTFAPTDEFLSDIPSGARISISGVLTSKAVSPLAAFTSTNSRFDGVTGPSVEALVGFVDTGTPATSRLIWFQDTGVTGLPVTPGGASYNIADPAGWFVL